MKEKYNFVIFLFGIKHIFIMKNFHSLSSRPLPSINIYHYYKKIIWYLVWMVEVTQSVIKNILFFSLAIRRGKKLENTSLFSPVNLLTNNKSLIFSPGWNQNRDEKLKTHHFFSFGESFNLREKVLLFLSGDVKNPTLTLVWFLYAPQMKNLFSGKIFFLD